MTKLHTGINEERRLAYRALFESLVLRPAYAAARAKITSDWDPQKGPAAVAELLKLEYALDAKKLPSGDDPQVKLDPLFALTLSPDDYAKYQKDNESLQKVANWIYTPPAGEKNTDGSLAWPAKLLSPGAPASLDAIKAGVTGTIAYWDGQFTAGNANRSATLAAIDEIKDRLKDFSDAQARLLASNPQTIDKIEVYNSFRDDNWTAQLAKLRAAGKIVSDRWSTLANGKSDALLATLYSREMDTLSAKARDDYKNLLALTELPQGADANSDSARVLAASHDSLKAALDRLDAQKAGDVAKVITDLDTRFIRQVKDNDGAMRPRFEVYQQLLDAADALMVKPHPKTSGGSLATAFADVDQVYTKASTRAEKLQVQAINKDDPLAQVIVFSQGAIDASARAKKYFFSSDALDGMPVKGDDWPAYIAKAAAAMPKDNLMRPQVPMITFPEPKETFNPQFAPDATGAVVDSLNAIARVTAVGTDAASAGKVLNAAQLAARAGDVGKGFSDYRANYIHYWREDVKDELHLSYKNFNALATDLVSVGEKSIRAQLDDYGKRMVYALNKVGATDDETAVRLGAQLGQNATFQSDCAAVISKWRELGDDPKIVRRSILNMIPGDFHDNYIVNSATTNDGFVGKYWQSFAHEALRVLAADSLSEIDAGLRDLANYQHFPLALPGDKKDDLPLADVLKARAALERVRGASAGAAASATNAGTRLIGAGGNTRDKEIDNNLDDIRGTNLLRDKQDYFDKLDRLFAGLPKDNKPLSVTLSVDKSKLTDRLTAISTPFSYMAISASGKVIGQPSSLISDRTDSYAIDLPNAGDLTFDFRTVENGNPIQTESFAGPWGILRLILSPNVKSITRDGNKWAIEYTVATADKKNWSLYLNLEFKQPIPDIKDWPNPPGK